MPPWVRKANLILRCNYWRQHCKLQSLQAPVLHMHKPQCRLINLYPPLLATQNRFLSAVGINHWTCCHMHSIKPKLEGFGVSNNMFNLSQVTLNAPLTLTYTTHSLNQWAVCPDMSTISVIVNETPTVQLTSTLEKDCAPAEILLTMKPIGFRFPVLVDWYISDGTDYLKGLNVSHVFKSAGSYR